MRYGKEKGLRHYRFKGVLFGLAIISVLCYHYTLKSYAFSGGSGTSGSPYQIATCTDLQNINTSLSSYYVLTGNIDCGATSTWNSGAGFVPLGVSTHFTGNLNGEGYTISNLTINLPGSSNPVGLFSLESGATITNLTLSNPQISGNTYVGALSGYMTGGTISTITISGGTVTSDGSAAGGVTGYINGGTISGIKTSATVTTTDSGHFIGGFSGTMTNNPSITNSSSSGNVSGGAYVGGFFGSSTGSGTVTNDSATGTVSGNTYEIGGFIGDDYGTSLTEVSATGTVNVTSATTEIGGLIGFAQSNITVSQSFSNGTINGGGTGGYCGGFMGEYNSTGTISFQNDYSTSNLTNCSIYSGGFIGWATTAAITINDSYSTGSVITSSTDSGFVGEASGTTFTNSFWDTTTSGQTTGYRASGSDTGSPTGETNTAMQNVATFTSTATPGLTTAWDFVGNPNNDTSNNNYWNINSSLNNGYPYLSYQIFPPNLPTALGPSSAVSGSYATNTQPTLSATLSDTNNGYTEQYEIQISTTSTYTSPVVDYTSALASPGTISFTVGQTAGSGTYSVGTAGQTLANGQYYWRIQDTNSAGSVSGWAAANNGAVAFGVDTTAPSVPGTPTTNSPTNNSTPTWSWTASTDSGVGLSGTPYMIEWSQSSAFSTYTYTSIVTNSYTMTSPLADGTWYFRVSASDSLGNTSNFSPNGTVLIDTTAPSVPGTPTTTSPTNNSTPTWSWTAATDSGSGLATIPYSVQWSQSSSFATITGSQTVTTTSFTQPSSLSNGLWYFRVQASDAAGNSSAYSANGTVDIGTTPPVISSITSTSSSSTSETISWTTNELGSSQVTYGPTTSYGSISPTTDTSPEVTSHSVTLSSLVACSVYHYEVTSIDSFTNQYTSVDNSFITSGCAGSAPVQTYNDSTISTNAGGSVSLTNNGVTIGLSVPSNATTMPADYQVKSLASATALQAIGSPSNVSEVGNGVYDITALANTTTAITSFLQPLTITMTYTLPEVANLEAASLTIYRWDNGTGWQPLSNCVNTTLSLSVSCTTTGFSTFALFGTAIPASTTYTATAAATSAATTATTASSGTALSTPAATAPSTTPPHSTATAPPVVSFEPITGRTATTTVHHSASTTLWVALALLVLLGLVVLYGIVKVYRKELRRTN